MASKALKGLTIKIGGDTSELTKALDGVDKQSKSLSSELGQINKLLKLDPKNTELLAQKQKVLADAIGATEKRLDLLKEAEKQAQEQFERGEITEEQYRAIQREVIATENKLKALRKAADQTADEMEDLGDSADDAGDELEDEADSAKKADKANEELDDSAGDLASGGLAALAAAAVAAGAAFVAMAESSREYRTEMGKLNTAFQDAGYSGEAATRTYEALQGVLGETDQAVEAANHLAKLCQNEEDLNAMTEALTGVYAVFGSSLPVEALAESANESARNGQIAGNLADAINWAAEAGETFGVKLKKNTKANEEWNKKVEEATTAEEYFNLALEQCSDEQERQKLITDTLTRLYGSAAKEYKKTNAEVIRANEATEKWNKATAKIGDTLEPVITDIKEMGVALLEDAGEPLEDIAEYIRKTLLPALTNTGKWVKQNMPAIKAGVVGVTAAMAAFKIATIANTVAQKGLKGAIIATTVAQKALALVQAATPWGLVLTAVVGVTAAVIALTKATKDARQPTQFLTTEEQKLVEASREAAEAFRDQQKATEDALGGILSEMDYVSDLAGELDTLVDKKGKVRKEDEARVKYILNQLNEKMGTEYELTKGLITNYKDLKTNIQEVIKQKTANLLIEAVNEDFVKALQAETQAWEAKTLVQKQYDEQLALTKQAESDYETFKADYNEKLASGYYAFRESEQSADSQRLMELSEIWEEEQGHLYTREQELRAATDEYNLYSDRIIAFEQAQEAAAAGNYEAVRDILAGKNSAYSDHTSTVQNETDAVIAELEKEAVDAGRKAEKTRELFEAGVEGYTEEMVKEAEQGYEDALGKWASAYSDGQGLGEDLGQGLADGIKLKNGVVGAAAIQQIREAVNAAKKAAEINSPSKKTMAIGEGLGEGAEVGIKKKTKDVEKAATNQAGAIIDAFRAEEINAQQALRNIADQQAARQTAGQLSAATANSGVLGQILQAIKDGQVLLLDGDTVVGGTAGKMDSRLGQLRILSARGAK